MTRELLEKYLNNQCSEDELMEVFQWISSGLPGKEGLDWARDIWTSSNFKEGEVTRARLDQLFDRIQSETQPKTIKMVPSAGKIITWMNRVAVILFLPLLTILILAIYQNKQKAIKYAGVVPDSLEITAAFGSKTVVQLSDGTEAHLNYGSSLKYPGFFTGNTRDVKLTGEAYFKVATNHEKPFVVHANHLLVKAVGTEFNVFAPSGENIIETTLVNGKVIVEKNSKKAGEQIISIMRPGQHLYYDTHIGEGEITEGNIDVYIAWKNGEVIFDDTPIREVAKRLSRMYNVDIKVSEDIDDFTYTVKFKDLPLAEVLDLMCIATPVRYSILPRQKLPDGSYTQRKVIIKNAKS